MVKSIFFFKYQNIFVCIYNSNNNNVFRANAMMIYALKKCLHKTSNIIKIFTEIGKVGNYQTKKSS